MQEKDVIFSKKYPYYQQGYNNRASSPINNRIQGSLSNKLSQSPGDWKKYMEKEPNIKSTIRRQQSAYLNNNIAQSNTSYINREQNKNDLVTFQKPTINKFQQKKRRKQQMLRRVEQIQRKVMPILQYHHPNQENNENFGWNNRMEQRILKLQTNLDMIQKQTEIKIQKRLLQVERQWNGKIQALLQSADLKNWKKQQSKSKLNSRIQNGYHRHLIYQKDYKQVHSQYKNPYHINGHKNQGYHTKSQPNQVQIDQQYEQNQKNK